MVRLEGWEIRLSQYLRESKNHVFEWGKNDCVLFAVKGAEIITGINTYNDYLGYNDEAGAFDIIRKNGGMESLISNHFGHSHKMILKAKRGDLALLKLPQLSLGIVDDSGQYVACVSEKGYARIPLIKAWRIWSYG
jgi:hypothetical protein